MPLTTKGVFMNEVLMCLSLLVWHEARGENYKGKMSVMEVAYNRSKHEDYPNNICNVIRQPRQFSWVNKSNISLNKPPSLVYKNVQAAKSWEESKRVAAQFMKNKTNYTNNALFFNTRSLGVRYKITTTTGKPMACGNHIFY